MRRAQVDILPSLYKCVVGVARVYAVLLLVWLRCVPFFSQAGWCPGVLRWVGMRCIDGLGRVVFGRVVFAPEAGRAYIHGGEVGGQLRTSSSVVNLGRAFFSLGKKKPKHTILYKEKCILCARTTLLLPVCRRERAADRSFDGTFLGLCILALHICPPSPPFKEVKSTKSEYERQKGQDRSSPLHPVFYFPHENPIFFVLLCYPLLCDPGWFY